LFFKGPEHFLDFRIKFPNPGFRKKIMELVKKRIECFKSLEILENRCHDLAPEFFFDLLIRVTPEISDPVVLAPDPPERSFNLLSPYAAAMPRGNNTVIMSHGRERTEKSPPGIEKDRPGPRGDLTGSVHWYLPRRRISA
jgi:hypothetical protein